MRIVCFIFCFLVLGSCKREPKVSSDMVVGAWEVIGAERNGKATETLNGAYFEFGDNGTMTSTYLGEDETSLFSVADAMIKQVRPDQSQIDFKVEKMAPDTMILETNIQTIPFRFVMRKIAAEDGSN